MPASVSSFDENERPTATKRSIKKSTKKKARTSSHLETLVSHTKKLTVDELLELYRAYDSVVIDYVFSHLLLPHTRFARTWLRDQVRDLCAGTDRNRLILTARERKRAEADFESRGKTAYSDILKPKHDEFARKALTCLRDCELDGVSEETLVQAKSLGVSRLVFDDMGNYCYALTDRYPELLADWCSAATVGDTEDMQQIEAQLAAIRVEIGIRSYDAWYVVINLRSCYDQIDRMVQTVCLGFARLLFRFAHQLRGVTSTEENFSAGYEGLMRAARNYDPVDGSSFTAHCQWWVRSAVLQRQRQASVILLPTTTWYQLSLLQRGNSELTDDRVSSLKERAEMFYTNSANASRSFVDDDSANEGFSFEAVRVTSPDAAFVLGDSLARSQATQDIHESDNIRNIGSEVTQEIISLIHEEDPSLLFPVLLWALNSGIDSTLLAEATAQLFVSEDKSLAEKLRHENAKSFQQALEKKNQTVASATNKHRKT
jgi:hypothetical protein